MDDLIKMTEFVLKNNYFKFDGQVKQQYLALPLEPNLQLHTLVFLWMMLQVNFLKLNRYNHKSGLDILMMRSLFGLMGKKSFCYSLPI